MAFLQSSRFDPCPRRTISSSISHQHRCQLDDQLIERLDSNELLGGHDSSGHPIGHTGCVNALSWSPSGQLLASGSDDCNVVLWKLGSEHNHPLTDAENSTPNPPPFSSRYARGASRRSARQQPPDAHSRHNANVHSSPHLVHVHADHPIVQPWPQRSFPSMDLGMLGKIETGHRANIFSVKWAPNASERRLFTCAGDSHVRVFDINYMSSATADGADGQVHRNSNGREWTTWSEQSGACVRLFRCHRGRTKRISTEVSPDVFLTCAEDGDVRQMDLRVPHSCRTLTEASCPPPLAHHPTLLYSLSVSKLEPWLFAVAGESPLAYLHDRRMIPRLLNRDWGMNTITHAQHDALTMCVRSFGIPPGGFEAPWVQNDGRTALVTNTPHSSRHSLLMGNRISITACKLSEHNGRDLLVSYSSGHIYRFDIYDQPGVLHANLENARYSLDADDSSQSTRAEHAAPDETDHSQLELDEHKHVETGELKSRSGIHGQEESVPVAVVHDDGEEAGAQCENEIGQTFDTRNYSDNEGGDDDSEDDDDGSEHDEDEQVDQIDDEDNDESGLSEGDLMDLLQEDSPLHSFSATGPAVPTVYPRSAYKGHCNKETVKDVAFAGRADDYVISGSDDGNWFMWHKLTSEIKGIWHGDSSVVNVMAMHPDLPVFAISGIDDTIKIFSPISVTPFPPSAAAQQDNVPTSATQRERKRARTEVMRAHKIADRLQDKDEVCERNERQLQRDFSTPSARILLRLHPGLLGIDVDDDPERQLEGDCTVM